MINWVHSDAMKRLKKKVENGEELTEFERAELRVIFSKVKDVWENIWEAMPQEFKDYHEEVKKEMERV